MEKGAIAIITARAGSKGLKDKNIKALCGKPLLAYSIEAAIESACFQKVFVSTDSEKYADIAKAYGADASFLRSPEMASDIARSWDVVKEVVEEFDRRGEYYDKIMLLQPTSPLRSASDITACFAMMREKNARFIIGVVEMEHSPLWSNVLPEDLSMDHFKREEYFAIPRQQLPKYYRINGAVYLIQREELYEKNMLQYGGYAYIMPPERSIDIDTELDFQLAELIMQKIK